MPLKMVAQILCAHVFAFDCVCVCSCVCVCVFTKLQQVCGGEVTVGQVQAAAVRLLPQPLEEETQTAPSLVCLALRHLGNRWSHRNPQAFTH